MPARARTSFLSPVQIWSPRADMPGGTVAPPPTPVPAGDVVSSRRAGQTGAADSPAARRGSSGSAPGQSCGANDEGDAQAGALPGSIPAPAIAPLDGSPGHSPPGPSPPHLSPLSTAYAPYLVPPSSDATLIWEPCTYDSTRDSAAAVWAMLDERAGRRRSTRQRGRWVVRLQGQAAAAQAAPGLGCADGHEWDSDEAAVDGAEEGSAGGEDMAVTPSDFTVSAYLDDPTHTPRPDRAEPAAPQADGTRQLCPVDGDMDAAHLAHPVLFDMAAPLVSAPAHSALAATLDHSVNDGAPAAATPCNTPVIRRETLRRHAGVRRRPGLGRRDVFLPSPRVPARYDGACGHGGATHGLGDDGWPAAPLETDVRAALDALGFGAPMSACASEVSDASGGSSASDLSRECSAFSSGSSDSAPSTALSATSAGASAGPRYTADDVFALFGRRRDERDERDEPALEAKGMPVPGLASAQRAPGQLRLATAWPGAHTCGRSETCQASSSEYEDSDGTDDDDDDDHGEPGPVFEQAGVWVTDLDTGARVLL